MAHACCDNSPLFNFFKLGQPQLRHAIYRIAKGIHPNPPGGDWTMDNSFTKPSLRMRWMDIPHLVAIGLSTWERIGNTHISKIYFRLFNLNPT